MTRGRRICTVKCPVYWVCYSQSDAGSAGPIVTPLQAHPTSHKVCIKSPCTSISTSSAVLTVHELSIQTLLLPCWPSNLFIILRVKSCKVTQNTYRRVFPPGILVWIIIAPEVVSWFAPSNCGEHRMRVVVLASTPKSIV